MKYNLVSRGDGSSDLTLFVNGEMYLADDQHMNFKSIVAGILAGDESVVDLFDIEKNVNDRFALLSERVSVKDGQVYFDGEVVNNALTEQVIRFMDEGADFAPLVNFFEKIAVNPNEHSREQFYEWLNAAQFTILPDGDVLAYKGVYKTGLADAPYESVSSGTAIVNGVEQSGRIKQGIGDVVTMPRNDVTHNPNLHCSQGLHAGTWQYASTFVSGPSSAILTVRFNPRDVVSVPNDHSAQKIRVCRYVVVDVTDAPLDRALAQEPVKVEQESDIEVEQNDEDLCPECGLDEIDCCYSDVCDDCGEERDAEQAEQDAVNEAAQKVWDTRYNYTKQERGPGGRFLPKQ